MFPVLKYMFRWRWSLPRIRGGVSYYCVFIARAFGSSPHTRGCFLLFRFCRHCVFVFPAYAGVFLCLSLSAYSALSLPRIRGGVSPVRSGDDREKKSSPHTRGCFFHEEPRPLAPSVFPAYAGVFLTGQISISAIRRLPRIRGGVSYVKTLADRIGKSSPHTRG